MRRSIKNLLTITLSVTLIVSTISYSPMRVNAAPPSAPITNTDAAEFSSYVVWSGVGDYSALDGALGKATGTIDGTTYTNYALSSKGATALAGVDGDIATNATAIIDGNITGGGVENPTTMPSYYVIDLKSVKSTKVILAKWATQQAVTYTLEFSENGQNWTTVTYLKDIVKEATSGRIDKYTLTEATNTRYVRMTLYVSTSAAKPQLREISIFGDDTNTGGAPHKVDVPWSFSEKLVMPEYNLAYRKTGLYQSGGSTGTNGGLSVLTDGKIDGVYWASQAMSKAGDSDWFIIDLENEYTLADIDYIHLEWRQSPNRVPIDGLKIKVTDNLVQTTTGSGNATVTQDYSEWTSVYNTSTPNIAANNYKSEIRLENDQYTGRFRYIKVQSDWVKTNMDYGIQCVECAVFKAENTATGIKTSNELTPLGYQLSSDIAGIAKNAPAFRIVSKCPSTVLNKNVKSFGTIYVPTSEVSEDKVSDFLTCEVKDGEVVAPTVIPATEKGIIEDWDTTDIDNKYYIATIKKSTRPSDMAAYCRKEYYVRTYCVVEGQDGDEYVYSNNIQVISIYKIAQNLYTNQKMNSLSLHEYLYNNIISIVNPEADVVDFNWGNSIFVIE